jgi:hypothetical protein
MTAQTQALAQRPPVAEGARLRFAARSLPPLHRVLNRIVDRMFSLDLDPEEISAMLGEQQREASQFHSVGIAAAHEHANTLPDGGLVRPAQ